MLRRRIMSRCWLRCRATGSADCGLRGVGVAASRRVAADRGRRMAPSPSPSPPPLPAPPSPASTPRPYRWCCCRWCCATRRATSGFGSGARSVTEIPYCAASASSGVARWGGGSTAGGRRAGALTGRRGPPRDEGAGRLHDSTSDSTYRHTGTRTHRCTTINHEAAQQEQHVQLGEDAPVTTRRSSRRPCRRRPGASFRPLCSQSLCTLDGSLAVLCPPLDLLGRCARHSPGVKRRLPCAVCVAAPCRVGRPRRAAAAEVHRCMGWAPPLCKGCRSAWFGEVVEPWAQRWRQVVARLRTGRCNHHHHRLGVVQHALATTLSIDTAAVTCTGSSGRGMGRRLYRGTWMARDVHAFVVFRGAAKCRVVVGVRILRVLVRAPCVRVTGHTRRGILPVLASKVWARQCCVRITKSFRMA